MRIIEEMKKAVKEIRYEGYYYKLSEVVEILILGLLCQNKALTEIHMWATSKQVKSMLQEKLGIKYIPCYWHLCNLVGMIDSNEPNRMFMDFFGKL